MERGEMQSLRKGCFMHEPTTGPPNVSAATRARRPLISKMDLGATAGKTAAGSHITVTHVGHHGSGAAIAARIYHAC